ncbi:hypothetical protein MMC26_004588 [Xylographa opegraphella]|nr:hypothetical protein [Xylographa opegraphella]
MEKLGNILNPGSKHDNEVLYGSGQSSEPIHTGTSTNRTGSAQGRIVSQQEDGAKGNEAFSSSSNNISTDGPFSRDLSSAQRPGLSSEVGSTTAIRDGVPGATSGSGLNGTTETDTILASSTGGSAYETDRRLDPAGQAAGTSESPAAQSALKNDSTTTGSGLTGNTYPDRSVGSASTAHPSATDKIGEIASGRGEEGPQENLGSSLTEREFPLGGTSSATTGTGGPTSSTTSHPSHLERDATLGGAASGAAGLAEHEHHHDIGNTSSNASGNTGMTSGHSGSSIDPCGPGAEPAAPHFVPGPHVTDTANRLDPHADGPGFGPGTDAVAYTTTQPHSTIGQGTDPAVAQTEHKPSLMDRLTGNKNDTAPTSNVGGVGSTGSTTRDPTMFQETGFGPSTGKDKDRDAAFASGTGAAAYDAERPHGSTTGGLEHDTAEKQRKPSLISRLLHPGKHDSETVEGSDSASSTHPSHKARDAALVGGMGGAAYEAERRGSSGVVGADRKASTASSRNLGMDPGASDVHHKSGALNTLDPRVPQQTTSDAGYAAVEHPPVADATGHKYGVADSGGMQGNRVVVPYEENAAPLYKHDGGAYTDEEKHGKKGAASRHGSTAVGAETGAVEEKERKPSIFSRLDPRKKSTTSQTNVDEGFEDKEKLGGAAAAGAGMVGVGYEAEKHGRESTAATSDPKTTGVYTPLEASGPPSYKHNPDAVAPDTRAPGLTSPNDPKVTGVYTPLEANGPPAYRHNSEATAAGVGPGGLGATGAGYEAERHGHGSQATSAGTGEFSKREAEKEAKHEKHHEKALEKEGKHREKEIAKEEKHDGKKHGGILGFLHRDKTDKELKEEEAERQESSTYGISGAKPAEEGAAGPGAIGINEHEREEHAKHERNRLHKAGSHSLHKRNLTDFRPGPSCEHDGR